MHRSDQRLTFCWSRSSFVWVLAAICCALLIPAGALPQSSRPTARPVLSKAEALKILRENESPDAAREEAFRVESLGDSLGSIHIVKHFRGPDGAVFQEAQPKPLSDAQKVAIRNAANQFQSKLHQSVQVLKSLPPVKACAADRTIKDKERNPRTTAPSDTLYVRGPFPEALRSALGENTKIVQCSDRKGDHCAISALDLNLRCLPTRVILTGRERIAHEGAPALRYYGKGKATIQTKEVKSELAKFLERPR